MDYNMLTKLQNHIPIFGFKIVPCLEKSHGSYLYNKINNKEVLDFGFNQFGSLAIGYNHPKLTEEYFDKLLISTKQRISLSGNYPEEYINFVDNFKKILPLEYQHFFFIDGGAPAVENAIKAAFDWKTQKNINYNSNKIIHFKNAFHGRLGYSLSLTNTLDKRKTDNFPKFKWPRVHNPIGYFFRDGSISYNNEGLAKEQIEHIFKKEKDSIVGIIIEPIQGNGGDGYFNPTFFNYLKKVTYENDALLLFDEIQTGWSIGSWWAFEKVTNKIKPDILIFGKKVQQSGITCTKRIDEIEENVFTTAGRIASTWGGNLTDMIRSTEYMRIIKEEKLHNNIKKIGAKIQEILYNTDHRKITNIRGIGGFQAFDLPNEKIRDKICDELYNKDCLVLKSGKTSIRLRPNLAITKEELEIGLEIILETLEKKMQ